MHEFILNELKILEFVPEGRVVVLDTIYSTNQYVIDNLNYLKSGDVFIAGHQTRGRGRRGKQWISSYGKSICLSMYWKLNQKIPIITELSVMVSFVVAKVLKNLGVHHIKIKWPNDLYVFKKKLAGILIEILTKDSKVSHLIIGIGINVSICDHNELEDVIKKSWIDLKNIGIILNNNVIVINLINSLRQALKYFGNNKYNPFVHCQKIEDYLYNKSVMLLVDNYTIKCGISLGMQSNGMLAILDKTGTVHQYYNDNISVYLV